MRKAKIFLKLRNGSAQAFTFAIVFLLLFFAHIKSVSATPPLLTPGQTHKLPLSRSAAIHIAGRGIIDAQEQGPDLILRGLKPGRAEVEIANQKNTIFVMTQKQKVAAEKIQSALENMQGLQLDYEDNQIQVTGQLLRLKDWQTIHQLNLQEPFIFKALPDADVQPQAKQWIHTLIQNAGLPRAQIHWSPAAQLTLPEEYRQHESQWRRVTDSLGLQIDFQKSELALEPLVRIHIFVAEVNKSAKSQFGITWPDQAEAQLAPHFTGIKQLSVFLKGLEQKGLGQILASPNLLARSGGTAEFLAGGEFPIKIITPSRREVVWKQHGISLKIKPKADRTGRLSVELSTEISIVDSSQAYEGLPGMKTNRMSTHFDLNQAQTIVLSGLIRHDWGHNNDGLSGLSQVPLLGRLFRSESFLNQKSELIIFVTPELVSEESSEKPQFPEGWKNYATPD